MRLQYKLKKIFLCLTLVSTIISVLTSFMYFYHRDSVVWSIVNNVVICIATGCVIGLVQSFIGYKVAKREAVLNFYKSTVFLDKEIIEYQFYMKPYVEAREGFITVNRVLKRYEEDFINAYRNLYFSKHNDEVLDSCQKQYCIWSKEVIPHLNLKEGLEKAITFENTPDKILINKGINIEKHKLEINKELQDLYIKVVESYNNEKTLERYKTEYKIIEDYLFPERVSK